MAQLGKTLSVGFTLNVIFAAILHHAAPDFISTPVPPQTTTPPHKGTDIPAQGVYNVKNESGTVCLKANMGLQINISLPSLNTTELHVMNLDPAQTSSSGSCADKSATLILNSRQGMVLTFTFSLNTTSKEYHLNSVSISVSWPDVNVTFSAHNDTLDYLRGRLGFSYMCRSEQTLVVSQNVSLNTYLLHVQPFGLTGDTFGSALECLLDEDDLLVPIVVGAALAGLVLVVLLAYLIGRKRSQAGYQTI